MSGEMIAIVAVGVALAGVILASLRGTEARRSGRAPRTHGEAGRTAGRIARGHHRAAHARLKDESDLKPLSVNRMGSLSPGAVKKP